MNEVVICVGIPASGKSTFSKELIKNNPEFYRINRDSFRYMMKESMYYTNPDHYKTELIIDDMVLLLISNLLNNNFNVIIDETNVRYKHLMSIVTYIKNNFDVKISFKIFDIPLKEALDRNSKRTHDRVDDVIMDKMYNRFRHLTKSFNFTEYGEII